MQEQASNSPKLRWQRAMVVSISEKGARIKMRHVSIGETSESEPVDEASKEIYR